ncbi:hypothetical protein PSACC_00778 [Paramicrosporidium saccamoebae]|uniref:Uncharacterized protein n=1 Tax=Paramicrosporidium saccamoebae TaxID=1246581 RepID=A0A2H9TNV6_9FUNG|nr:hypothetical protein PSACC_00778 [Paramicrosporidium saccamoebae]
MAIEKTGCSELNDVLLLCYDKTRDWRKCRAELQAFRECYEHNKDPISANLEKKPINMDESTRKEEDSLLDSLYSDRVPVTLCPRNTPTMAAEFANTNGHHLLLGNEAGDVALVDCRRQSDDIAMSTALQAYPDAIFDVTWRTDDHSYALAVGDQHVYVHDSKSQAVQQCLGHHGSSVRMVRYRPGHPDILVTAGRDGCMALWDLRTADTNSTRNKPISLIEDAHSLRGNGRTDRNGSSVTAFRFMPLEDHLLCSIGQPDYAIRFWDVRYTRRRGQTAQSVAEISPSITGRRPRAFTSLCTDSQGSHLYAVSSDNHIYKYLTSNYSLLETLEAPGFRTSGSFYIRSAMAPDDQFLLCGSTEGTAYIWPTSVRRQRVFKLHEHRFEVSCVAWSKVGVVFVGGEDYVSRIWRTDGRTSNIDTARHVKLEPIEVKRLEAVKTVRSQWKLDTPSPLHQLGDWPLRSVPPVVARVPFANLINSSVPSTPKRKRQALLDTFFTPNKQARLGLGSFYTNL